MATIPAQVTPIELKADKEPSFWISKQEWFTVQMYVEIGLLLPTNPAEMPFDDIRATYMEIKAHCQTWKESIYPNMVKLASQLSDYSETAKTYYGALKTLQLDLQSGNPSKSAEKEFNVIVEHLNRDTENYHQKAEAASASIGQLRQDYFFTLKKLYQLDAIYKFQSDYSSTHLAFLGIKSLKEVLGNALAVIDKIYQVWQLLSSDLKFMKVNKSDEYKMLNKIYNYEEIVIWRNISKYTKQLKPIL